MIFSSFVYFQHLGSFSALQVRFFLCPILFLAYEDLWQYVGKNTDPEHSSKPFYCKLCNNFTGTRRGLTRNHVESIHFPGLFLYSCSLCTKTFKGRNALGVHMSTVHNNAAKYR